MYVIVLNSFYLWSISTPGRNGTPRTDLTEDVAANVTSNSLTPDQLLLERVIAKTFTDNNIRLDITDTIRAAFRTKLWRMGQLFISLGTNNRKIQLQKWMQSEWRFTVNESEVVRQVMSRKRESAQLESETQKRQCLEQRVTELKSKVHEQEKTRRSYLRKPFEDCTRQRQLTRVKEMVGQVKECICAEGYNPCSLEVQTPAGLTEVFDLSSQKLSRANTTFTSQYDKVRSSLCIKDKFTVPFEAYHELSMLSDLPSSSQVKKLTTTMNSEFNITSCPNNIIGVQQSIKERIKQRIKCLVKQNEREGKSTPSTIRIKLTGDGTQIGRGLNVVNIAFTIIDEGEKVYSVLGNYSLAILKIGEKYEELAAGLQDIIAEAENCEVVNVDDKVYNIEFYLGGDLKFLAIVCGIDAANADHACIWCKCPKEKRDDMTIEWSITDVSKGARTIEEILDKCTLGKQSKNRFNCSRAPLFQFIPIKRVIIDTLHLFLRISDNLTDLLIRDLRLQDSRNKKRKGETNLAVYEKHLNETCNIRFKWNTDHDTKEIKYRDLTGPEKLRLFKNTDLTKLFPLLPKVTDLQGLWSEFFSIINDINKEASNANDISAKTKAWVTKFTAVYQAKDVTPYIHACGGVYSVIWQQSSLQPARFGEIK